ncbi:MAG: ABC transporter substrate-binding protein [candidate division WOR-3 bacterium]
MKKGLANFPVCNKPNHIGGKMNPLKAKKIRVKDTLRSLSISMLFLSLLASFFIACPGQKEEIKIGVVLPMTGGLSAFGQEGKQAIDMAVEKLNANGGILGRKVRVIYEDGQGTPAQTVNAVKKLIETDKVVALIGEVASSNTLAAAPIAQEKKIPLLVPASTNVEITKVGDYIARVCFIDAEQGRAMADFCYHQLKKRRAVLILDQSSDYSVGLAQEFIRRFKELGGEVLGQEAIQQGTSDFRTQLAKVSAKKADFIYVPVNYQEAGLILKQAKELGIKTDIVGSDAWSSPKLFEIAGDAANGQFITAHFSPDAPDSIVRFFVDEFKQKYGINPSNMSALSYDAANLLFDAIRRAGTTKSDKIKDAINSTRGFRGVTGEITLDSMRNPIKPIVILKTDKGQFAYAGQVK